MWAFRKGHIDIVKLLIESKANIDIQDENVSEIIAHHSKYVCLQYLSTHHMKYAGRNRRNGRI